MFIAIIFLLTLMELLVPVLFVVALVAGVSLFTPYEAFVEVSVALAIFLAVVVGFLIHPRRDIYYVRTSVRLIDPDRRETLEHDFLAVRVELVRLWLLFVPTSLSVAVFVFFAASGPAKFSYLNCFFFLTLCVLRFFALSVSAPARFCVARALDRREKGPEGRCGVQCNFFPHLWRE
jgi:hypothetical protein